MMALRFGLVLGLMVAVNAFAACGSGGHPTGGSSGTGGGTAPDAGPDAMEDGGDAEAGPAFPAFAVDAPQIRKNQGAVLASPVIVTVTWPADDTNAATWDALDDGLGSSTYWTATTSEYGVGTASSGDANHVHMTQPLPASLSYTDLQSFVLAALSGAPADAGADAGTETPWPAPTLDVNGNSQTIYSLFIPPSTSVTDPGTGMSFCVEGGLGYHDDVVVNGTAIAYSVTLQCPPVSLPDVEETAAHETIEAATDPYPSSATLGYAGFDSDHLAWDLYTGFADELADACQSWKTSYVQDSGSFPYWVQLSWSNVASLGGHDPCVPAAPGPYHGMTLFPMEESAVTVDLSTIGSGKVKTRAFKVTVGQPLTFHVGFFSDAATGPWKIAYDFPKTLPDFDQSFNPLGNGSATVTLDKTMGQNGDQATVTVTPTKKGEGGFQLMAITWDAPPAPAGYYLPRYLPILLVDE